jgi:hypothetical protein
MSASSARATVSGLVNTSRRRGMQLDLRYALIGQLYEQAVLLTAKLEQLAKENAELKSAAEKPQDPA